MKINQESERRCIKKDRMLVCVCVRAWMHDNRREREREGEIFYGFHEFIFDFNLNTITYIFYDMGRLLIDYYLIYIYASF